MTATETPNSKPPSPEDPLVLPADPDRWTSFDKDAWPFDPAKDPAWQDPTRTRRRIGTPEELALVAEAIIHEKRLVCTDAHGNQQDIVAEVGHSHDRHHGVTQHVCIENLRDLIETLQSTDGVCLARVESEYDSERFLRVKQRWNELREHSGLSHTDRAPTPLTLWHCTVRNVEHDNLSALEIAVTLNAACCFAADATFVGASFAADASFYDASFAAHASFDDASFAARASFYDASFAARALFYDASFAADASFDDASFAVPAIFMGASFAADASFKRASFAADAWFGDATIHADLILTDAEIERRLDLETATFHPKSRLALNGLIQRAGASVLLDPEDLTRVESDRELLARWLRRRKALALQIQSADSKLARARARLTYARVYLAQAAQFIATSALADPLEQLARELTGNHRVPLGLAVGRRGTLIKGEDADDDTKEGRDALTRAARDYNQLRDFFRAQQSTDAHEEICTIKHHDLARRARERSTVWSHLACAFHWLVMRNLLGYLVKPGRMVLTGILLILLFSAIYKFAIGVDDINHGSFDPVPTDSGYEYRDAYEYWNSDPLNPLYLSLMTFVTLGYGDFQPAAGWLKLVTGIEGLLGVTLLALFTVTWGRKMVR